MDVSTPLKTASLVLAVAMSLQGGPQLQPRASTHPCLFDLERGEVPDCLTDGTDGCLYVTPQIRKQLTYDSHGLAAIHTQNYNWMYVDRRGWVVARDVPTYDNGPEPFNDGLVRFVREGKYGVANRKGQVVVAPIYDGAMPFENGRATVCNACLMKTQGEYSWFDGGTWLAINAKGKVIAEIPQPRK